MNIFIFDDDIVFLKTIKNKLSQYFSNSKIHLSNQLIANFNNAIPDIIFLDIMFDNISSFHYGKYLLENYPKALLVYMSNIDHLVFDTYLQNTFFFVRKSNLEQDLFYFYQKYNDLKNKSEKTLTVYSHKKEYLINHNDIILIESSANYVLITTTNFQLKIRSTLKDIYSLLNNENFYRFNKYFIINLSKVINYDEKYIYFQNKKIEFTRGSRKKFLTQYSLFRRNQL